MLKKFLPVFVLVLILFSAKQVKAVSVNDVICPEISYCTSFIETRIGEQWDSMPIDKMDMDNLLLFKLGSNNIIGVELTVKSKEYMPIVLGVLKNGYGKVNSSTYGITEEKDFYLATKMAVNSAYLGDEISDDYRKMEVLSYGNKARAKAVMDTAEAILNKGKEFANNISKETYELVLLKEERNQGEVSRVYKVKNENVEFKEYTVNLASDNEIKYKILDNVTGEEKTTFLGTEDCFKVVVSEEKSSNIELNVESKIHGDRIFVASDNRSDYIVYSEQDETVNLSDNFQIIHEEETEEKPEGGSGDTKEDGSGNDVGEDTKDDEKNEGDVENGENKKDEDISKEPEGGEEDSKSDGAKPDEGTKEELKPDKGESGFKPEDTEPKDETIKSETKPEEDTTEEPNDKGKRRR